MSIAAGVIGGAFRVSQRGGPEYLAQVERDSIIPVHSLVLVITAVATVRV